MSLELFEAFSGTNSHQAQSGIMNESDTAKKTSLWYYSETTGEKLMIPQYAGYFSRFRQLLQTLKYRMAANWNQ